MKISLVGTGSIGSMLAKAIEQMKDVEKLYIMDRSIERAKALASSITKGVKADSLGDILTNVDLVIEAASQGAVKEMATLALEHGKDLMIMSVGALGDERLRDKIEELAKRNRCKVYMPSGAIAGIDGIKSASAGKIKEVNLITTKPPVALKGIEYLEGVDLENIKKPTTLFKGPAREAVRLFPKSVNVAATLSLSGIGFDRTLVEIIVDPKATRITHKIIAKGDFGEVICEVNNVPSPVNPKTSYLAALSAISMIKRILSPIQIGT